MIDVRQRHDVSIAVAWPARVESIDRDDRNSGVVEHAGYVIEVGSLVDGVGWLDRLAGRMAAAIGGLATGV